MTLVIDAFREQLVGLLPRLRRFARSLVRNRDDADDLVQIAIERALLRFEQWNPDMRLESWMFGIVKNAWIDDLRSKGRHSKLFAPEELGEHVGAATTDGAIQVWSLEQAMTRLPDEQRLAVSLVLIEGLSYKEAAEVMEVPVGTLTSRLARGREALETLLADPEEAAS